MRDDAKRSTFTAGPDLLRMRVREEYTPKAQEPHEPRVPLALLTAADYVELERRRKMLGKAS